MALPIYKVDAFTAKPFTGNPAGVCILTKKVSEEWMKAVAREMNLSETAFLLPVEDAVKDPQAGKDKKTAKESMAEDTQVGKGQLVFNLRWFTPMVEVDLCGHATLASAHILWETGRLLPSQQARFHTRSGMLTADLRGDWIEMNFPSKPEQPATIPVDFPAVLGVQPKYVGRNQFDYLVEVENEIVLRNMKPDFVRLAKMPVRGVIATCLPTDTNEYDFISRFFAPAVGVNEDPVTGSAHACLGWFWGKRLGKTEMTAYQASARGGIVKVRLAGDRVFLCGQAVTVVRGEIISI
jgi:PhzF family phenazine biosynthesis protein